MKNLKDQFNTYSLTEAEKAAMRVRLYSAMSTPRPSPYVSFAFQFTRLVLPAVLVLVLVGGGTAYAAEGSLPGSPLYTVKVNVNEPIQEALAVTPTAKAAVHVELAQRRVEEAEALASQGKLDASTTQRLEQNLESHAQSANELAVEVGATDPSAAVEIETKLSSSLAVHSAILSNINDSSNDGNPEHLAARAISVAQASASSSDNDQGSGSQVVRVAVRAAAPRGIKVFVASSSTSSQNVATSTETTTQNEDGGNKNSKEQKSQNSELKSRAQDALEQAQSDYADVENSLDATTSAQLDAQFAQAQSLIGTGDYTNAMRLAIKLDVIINAQHNYRNKNIITPLLKLQINTDEHGSGHGSHDSGDNEGGD